MSETYRGDSFICSAGIQRCARSFLFFHSKPVVLFRSPFTVGYCRWHITSPHRRSTPNE